MIIEWSYGDKIKVEYESSGLPNLYYDVLYSYKDENIYFRRKVTWTEAEEAKELLIENGIPEVEIYIRLSKED